jgi:hypothetical protein
VARDGNDVTHMLQNVCGLSVTHISSEDLQTADSRDQVAVQAANAQVIVIIVGDSGTVLFYYYIHIFVYNNFQATVLPWVAVYTYITT